MERLWAPWRMRYVVGPKQPGGVCVFCAAAAGDDDEGNLVLDHGPECFVILNRYPYNPGHLMVVPRRHVCGLSDVSETCLAEMMLTAARWTAVLSRALGAGGFNLGLNLGSAAGAGIVDHLHLHVVPRWDGDTNFMPVVGETKVMPEDLPATWAKLRAAWLEAEAV